MRGSSEICVSLGARECVCRVDYVVIAVERDNEIENA